MCDYNHINMNILDTLTKEELNLLTLHQYKKDEIIFYENEECFYVSYIVSGEVSIVSKNYLGSTVLFNRLESDEMFGNNLIFSSDPRYKGDVIANKDTTLYLISKKVLIHLLQHNLEFLIKYQEIQSNFGKNLNDHIKLLSLSDVDKRLMFYLKINKGSIKYKSVTLLAKELYLSRESLSRTLSRLEKDKKIIRTKTYIKVVEK